MKDVETVTRNVLRKAMNGEEVSSKEVREKK